MERDFILLALIAMLGTGVAVLVVYIMGQLRTWKLKARLFLALPDPWLVVAENGRIVYWNEAADKLGVRSAFKLQFKEGLQAGHGERFGGQAGDAPVQISINVNGQRKWYGVHAVPLQRRRNDTYEWLIVFHDISSYKQLETALETSQALYRNVTEQADDGIAIIKGQEVVYVNPRLLAMTGYLPGDILYRHFDYFIPAEHVHKVVRGFLGRVKGDTQPFLYETVLKCKDGRELPVEAKIGLMSFEGEEAALVMLQDITARKVAEAQLRLQGEALRSAGSGFMITDCEGTIQWVNTAFEHMTGYTLEEVRGQNSRLFRSGKQEQKFYARMWNKIKSGEVWQGELVNRKKDGELYDEQMTIAPVNDDTGQITHFVAIKENITERKQAEEALRRSERQFQELVMNTPVAMMVYRKDDQLMLINWRFSETYGYTPEHIPTIEHWWLLAFPDEMLREQIKRDWNTQFNLGILDSAGFIPMETEVVTKSGAQRFVRFSLVKLEDKYILSLLDQTKQKQAEMQLRQRARHLALLNEITSSALRNNDIATLCQELADQMGVLFEADGCFISLWDGVRQLAVPVAAYGPMRNTYARVAKPEVEEPTLTEAVLKAGHPIAVEDVFNSPYMSKRIAQNFPTRSVLGLPLIANDEKLGAALISFERHHVFTQEEIDRGSQVARQVALGIAKVKLFEAEAENHQLALVLVEVSTLLSSSMNVNTLLPRMLDLIQRVVPYDAGSVLVINEGRTHVLAKRGYERFGEAMDAFMAQMELDVRETPNLRKMAETKQPLIVPDKEKEPNWIRQLPDTLFRSWAGSPIHYNGEVLALISIEKQEPDSFRPEHVGRLEAFAGQAAVVLENARLFDEVHQLAIIDTLTGAFTRRHILELAVQEIERVRRYDHGLCIFMLDIDHFKVVNDTYGHLFGDTVLQKVIQWSWEILRRTDKIGRYGGEEFLIMLPETQLANGLLIAERIRGQIEKMALLYKEKPVRVTVSIGVSCFLGLSDEEGEDILKTLIEEADQALYAAKTGGRNRILPYALEV
jgi:diguanylate cyclase (GGDEF)-like protein/PAS domain S-box-containing protein